MEDKAIFDNWEKFKELLLSTNRLNIDKIIKWLDETDFKFAPASTQYHYSFRGGLLAHSLDVYYHMFDFKSMINLFNLSKETIIITALLHDICKVNVYKTDYRNVKDENGQWIKVPVYKFEDVEPLGHAEKSIITIMSMGVPLTQQEIYMIRNHMGFSNGEDERRVSKNFTYYPESLILHFADMSSTFIFESKDLKKDIADKLIGRNITESLSLFEQKVSANQSQNNVNNAQKVVINGTQYTLAPQNAIVDGKIIIEIPVVENGINKNIKVYSPYQDGLPF